MKNIRYEDIWEFVTGNSLYKTDEAELFYNHLNNLSLKILNKSFDSIKIDKEKDKDIVFLDNVLKIPSKSSELFDFFIHGFNIENPENYFKAFKMHKESFGIVILDVINSYYEFVPYLLSEGMEKKKSDKILKELVSKLPHNISSSNQIIEPTLKSKLLKKFQNLTELSDSVAWYIPSNTLAQLSSEEKKSYPLKFGKLVITKENIGDDYWTVEIIEINDDLFKFKIFTKNSLKGRGLVVELNDEGKIYELADISGMEANSTREFILEKKKIPFFPWKVNIEKYNHFVYIKELK